MTEKAIAREIVDAAFRIHSKLGPGLLESVYDAVLAFELDRRGLRVIRQQPIPVVYEDIRLDAGFRADLVVEDRVILEIKAVGLLAPVHKKQLLTYLLPAARRQVYSGATRSAENAAYLLEYGYIAVCANFDQFDWLSRNRLTIDSPLRAPMPQVHLGSLVPFAS